MRYTVLFMFLFSILIAGGEVPPQLDPHNPQYEPGVVLVKFKDTVQLDHNTLARATNPVFGINSIDLLNIEYGVQSLYKVFSQQEKRSVVKMVQFPQGELTVPNLHNIYRIKYVDTTPIETIMNLLNDDPNVEYAEPNYYVGVMDVQVSDPMTADQWHIDEINASEAWEISTGDSNQVIGIVDTGVDQFHPDLANKMWLNVDEIPDNQLDDDGNGFVDDVHGWDFVNNDNNPQDDNSHGTHVAGIAAAEANNDIGVAGINWNAKIMPVKVFQSSGVGTYADVAAAIEYCAVNGASVINFSGGGYAESQLLHDAIAYAYGLGDEYGGTILVAAAGNSWYKIDWPFPPQPPTGPMYPACYGFVVGVEATQPGGNNSWFSNFDPSGPILSNDGFYWNEYDYNYEVRAPGSSILSTFPNGGYAVLSGTSMATPIVSAAVSLLKSVHPGESNETIMGKLIQSSHGGVIKLDSLLNWELEPDIHFHELMVVDSLPGSDGDQAVDAGESVEISLVVKNVGGQAENIWAKLRFGEFEDTTTATITKDSSHIGSVSSYALGVGSFDPFEVSFSSGLVNQRHVVFEYELGSGSVSLKSGNFTIVVENGVELNGTIHKLVLDSDAYYLVNEPAVIDTLIIKPGVTVRFSNQMFIMVTEYLSAVGVSDSMITFKGANDAGVRGIIMAEGANSNFEYCIFEDGWGGYTDPPYLVNPKRIHNSIFRNNTYKRPFDLIAGMDVQKNLIENNSYNGYGEHNLIMAWGKADTFRYNLISRNKDTDLAGSIIKFYGNQDLSYMTDNVFVGNTNYGVGTSSWNGWPMGVYTLPHQYWGGNDPDFVRSQILDFYESPDRAVLEPDSILTVPPIEVHGMVTDVAINGISINKYDNAWNHEDGLGAIGVDTMKFEIRFNRPMDISVNPFVTFGVRDPYTQNVVNDQSFWSSDSTLWTAYFITGLETGDGLNRMFVSRAYDMESFMIPIEDTRFEFYLQAAGALSVNFQAVPGIGKVDLDWPPSYTDDVLGYNMYRSLRLNDSNWTVFNIINNALIADSSFTDFSVIPDSAYRYRYTVLGTDFVESDHSRTVPATPFSAANGDANGDLSVNVLDIISMVSYVLEGDSQPFLFDAADLNGDDQVNVLDIISVINIILGNTAKIAAQSGEAIVALDAHELWISSQVSIGGLQLKISGQLENARISTPLGMELTNSMNSDGEMIVLLYSMSGQFIKAGSHSVIKIEGASDIIISELIVSDPRGLAMLSRIGDLEEVRVPDTYILKQNYPNPFNASTTIEYAIPEITDIRMTIYNIRGQEVFSREQASVAPGWYSFTWNGNSLGGTTLASGLYLYRFEAKGYSQTNKMLLLK